MTRSLRCIFFASAALGACAAASEDPAPEDARGSASALKRATATIDISAEGGGSCARACFDVESSKDIGFIAVDTDACGDANVELSLYSVDASGAKTPVDVTPAPHGNGKSCPDIPPDALKFDDLSGRHLSVCAAGAESADIFVKSGKTCNTESFEIAAEEQCVSDTPDWMNDMGSGSLSARSDVAVDPAGNVLFAGGSVTKLDGSGQVLWTVPRGERVAADSSGNVIAAGTFSTTIDLGFGPMVPTANSEDVFAAKLSRDGTPIWIETFGTSAAEGAHSVAVDPNGRIALAISGMGTLDLTPEGEVLWSKPFWGAVAFDADGNLAITGSFTETIDVGNGSVESTGGTDAFVVKLNPEGGYSWSQFLGDATTGSQAGTSVAFDPAGNALIVGEVTTSIRLFGTDHVMPITTESSNKAAYVAKLDASGDPVWAHVRLFTEDMLDVTADSAGNVYVTGGDVGNVLPFRYNFVEMLDASGVTRWRLGSTTSEWPGRGRGNSIALDACNNLFWALFWTSGPPDFVNVFQLAKIDR